MGSLRTLNTALVTYSSTYGGFPDTMDQLAPPAGGGADANNADLVDEVLAGGTKSGYVFHYISVDLDEDGNNDIYAINASPLEPGTTGQRHFFTDQTGVIRASRDGPADSSSPPIN